MAVFAALFFAVVAVGQTNAGWEVKLGVTVFAGLALALAIYNLARGVRQKFYFWLVAFAGFVLAGGVYDLRHRAVPPLW